MINLTARCPDCEATFRTDISVGEPLLCQGCNKTLRKSAPDFDADPTKCLVCPSTEMFIRKDFPQRVGVGIVVTGFVASSIAWYQHQIILTFAILFATALVDVVLYLAMGDVLECYRCHAQYRGLASVDGQDGFDLEIHEKFRQQEARLKEQQLIEMTQQAQESPGPSQSPQS